jgi:hypothetical protein
MISTIAIGLRRLQGNCVESDEPDEQAMYQRQTDGSSMFCTADACGSSLIVTSMAGAVYNGGEEVGLRAKSRAAAASFCR